MNILLVVKNMRYSNGGVCSHILLLIKGYQELGHKVYLASDYMDFDKEVRDSGAVLCSIPFESLGGNPAKWIRITRQLVLFCKKNQIDVIHLHTQTAIPMAAYIKNFLGIPYVWTNHIDDIPYVGILKLFHRALHFPIISVSNELKEDLHNRLGIPYRYVKVIPNGIDESGYTPLSDEEKAKLRESFQISSSEFNICLLARVAYNKGHDILVRAAKEVKDKIPNIKIHLLFAGAMQEEEWYKEYVEKYAIENQIKITYLGFQKPRDVLGISDLFVLPSRKEGFPVAAIESLVMRCPLIRSKTPGWGEFKDYSLVFNIDDVKECAEAICAAYENRQESTARTERGYGAVCRIYNHKKMAEKTLKVYSTLLKRKRMVVTVIIPLYKGEKYIDHDYKMVRRALEKADIWDCSEIIFVNDYPEELIDFERENCTVINNQKNLGIHGSRVEGLKKSQGEYIHFLDQDDDISGRFYQSQLRNIKNNDVIVANAVLEHKGYSNLEYRNIFEYFLVRHPLAYTVIGCRIESPGQCLIKRRSIPDFWKNNLLKSNAADDYMLWLSLFAEGKRFKINKDILYRHNYTGDNLSLDERKVNQSLSEMTGKLAAYYPRCITIKILKMREDYMAGRLGISGRIFFGTVDIARNGIRKVHQKFTSKQIEENKSTSLK